MAGLIVTPIDIITITIDNKTSQVSMAVSRNLSGHYVAMILARLVATLEEQAVQYYGGRDSFETKRSPEAKEGGSDGAATKKEGD